MPIYEYCTTADGCDTCKEPFEVVQAASEEPLSACPHCEQPVRRIISAFRVGKGNVLSRGNLEAHGFTQYTRKGKGYYEKTAGSGPGALAAPDS